MKNKNIWLLCILVILILSYILIPTSKKEEVFKEDIINEEKQISISVLKEDGNIDKINLEEYIVGVVAAEMPASFNMEALKAQAIASRTYAMYKIESSTSEHDVTTDVTTQSYITNDEMKTKWNEDYEYYLNIIKEAVTSTSSLVMKNSDEIICAYYFAISNGQTENVESVFGTNLEYIESVDSSWDTTVNNYEVVTTFTKEEFCSLLFIECSLITIDNIIRNETNHVDNLTVNNKIFKGTDFRHLLGIRSTDFYIEINNVISVTTKGYGHGVGMSQYGANMMAKNGSNYIDILNHYYKNIEITNI